MMSENPYAAKPWLEHYDENVPSHIDYPNINVSEFLDNSAKDFGGRTAIWFMKNKITYKKFKDIAERLATALVELGMKKGDVVAIMIPNFPQFIFSYYDFSWYRCNKFLHHKLLFGFKCFGACARH